MIKLFGLYKNGQLAKISQDGNHLESDACELTEDQQLLDLTPHVWTVREIPNDLEFPKPPRSNESLGRRGNGEFNISQSSADAIGKALERCEDSSIDWRNDDEWKTRSRLDKINGES